MAEPIYDEDKADDLDSLTPEALRNLEDQYSTRQDEAEDEAIEAGEDPEDLPRKGKGRKLRERSQASDDAADEALSQDFGREWQRAKEADAKSFYKKGQQPKRLGLSSLRDRRKLLFGLGAGGGLAIISLFAFFSFFSVFKLDGIMSNINQRAFARFNAAADRRSDKWIQSYAFLRLTQLKGASNADPDSEYFRANKVDTNNPIRDWYHTLRNSTFEADLAKQGIVFANRTAGKNVTFAVLLVDSTQVAGLTPGDFRNGDLVNQLRTNKTLVEHILAEVDLTKPGGNAEARKKIKNVVNEVARRESVLKRRNVRKAIQNMTGVRDWRFFETTRDKVDTTKINIRNKIVTKAVPESTLAGKFVRCVFGISDCRYSEDPVDPQYTAESALAGEADPNKPGDTVNQIDENGKPVSRAVDLGPAADLIKDIIRKAGLTLNGLNVFSTLDSLSKVNTAIKNNELSKSVAVARGVQAMGLYQVFETSKDQLKCGDVTSAEVNDFMKVIGPVASSEAWTKVVDGQGNAGQLTNNSASHFYCDPKNQARLEANPNLANTDPAFKFAYLCPDKQIGGTSNASTLESSYKQTIGVVLDPVLAGYNKVRKFPIFGDLITGMNKLIGKLSGVLTSALLDLLKVVGLDDNLQNALSWLVGKVSAFLGAGPIMTGKEPAGIFMNWLFQGGAYTAEATARTDGASKTTVRSTATARSTLAQYNLWNKQNQSLYDRSLSLANSDSLASRGLLAVSEFRLSSIGSLFNLHNIGAMFSSIFSPFSHQTLAAGINGYTAAKFAGIQTFDYPQQCYDLNPLTAQPLDGTNALDVFANPRKYDLTVSPMPVSQADLDKLQSWDTETNSLDFYAAIYHIIDPNGKSSDDDVVAEKIYNCNLLDNATRGSLANIYGYSKDNGLD